MIKAVHFKNFKALRDTTLPLGQLTILVGANGTGKSTALSCLKLLDVSFSGALTVGGAHEDVISVEIAWEVGDAVATTTRHGDGRREHKASPAGTLTRGAAESTLHSARIYSLQATALAQTVQLQPNAELAADGRGLAGVLDRLRDENPERWEALNEEFGTCLPEFDRILFDTPNAGHRAIKLRTRKGHHPIPAADISQGTLLALAILTLAHLPDPPPVLGLEEPGRGIHPRLLRDVKDAMCRLAFPESFGEKREPVQVVATTHSPYMLDLFRDMPEAIVIASKVEDNVRFERLVDMPNYEEILADTPLGEVWYSGILGGVPADK